MKNPTSPGAKPELKWIDIDSLTVDHRYQRATTSDRSKANIKRMAQEFSWSKFTPVIVAKPAPGKKYPVIDGQHRVLALLERGDIEDVPCYIVEAPEIKNQAESFIGINKNRLRMTPQAEFHALVASGDKSAVELKKILDNVGIQIPKYPAMNGMTKPNECQAVGTLKTTMKKYGSEALRFALSTIYEAFPDEPGQMRSMFIKTLAVIQAKNKEKIDVRHAIKVTADIDPEHLQTVAHNYQQVEGGTVLNAMIKAFVKAYNSGQKKDKHIIATGGGVRLLNEIFSKPIGCSMFSAVAPWRNGRR